MDGFQAPGSNCENDTVVLSSEPTVKPAGLELAAELGLGGEAGEQETQKHTRDMGGIVPYPRALVVERVVSVCNASRQVVEGDRWRNEIISEIPAVEPAPLGGSCQSIVETDCQRTGHFPDHGLFSAEGSWLMAQLTHGAGGSKQTKKKKKTGEHLCLSWIPATLVYT